MGGVGGSGRVSTSTRPWCNTASGSSGKSKGKQTKNNNQPIGHRVARGDRSSYAKVTTGYFIQVAMKQQQHQQDAALYAPSALLCCAIYSKRWQGGNIGIKINLKSNNHCQQAAMVQNLDHKWRGARHWNALSWSMPNEFMITWFQEAKISCLGYAVFYQSYDLCYWLDLTSKMKNWENWFLNFFCSTSSFTAYSGVIFNVSYVLCTHIRGRIFLRYKPAYTFHANL